MHSNNPFKRLADDSVSDIDQGPINPRYRDDITTPEGAGEPTDQAKTGSEPGNDPVTTAKQPEEEQFDDQELQDFLQKLEDEMNDDAEDPSTAHPEPALDETLIAVDNAVQPVHAEQAVSETETTGTDQATPTTIEVSEAGPELEPDLALDDEPDVDDASESGSGPSLGSSSTDKSQTEEAADGTADTASAAPVAGSVPNDGPKKTAGLTGKHSQLGPKRQARDPAPKTEAATTRPLLPRISLVLGAMALAAAGTGIMLIQNQNAQIAQLQAELQEITHATTGGKDPLLSELRKMQRQVNGMRGALTALQVAVKHPGPTQDDNERTALEALVSKVDALEHRLDGQPAPTPLVTKATAQVSETTPTAQAAAAPKPSAPAASGWAVSLASLSHPDLAAIELAGVKAKGIDNAVIQQAQVGSKQWYRVIVPGFSSRQAAQNAAVWISKKSGYEKLWVKRQGS